MKKIVLMLHGMGDLDVGEFEDQVTSIRDNILNERPKLRDNVVFKGIYYSNVFQGNQAKLFKAMTDYPLDYRRWRRFVLYSLGDAAALEHQSQKYGSPYEKVQEHIYNAIEKSYLELDTDDAEVIILAHSLGCQVISNYIWDAQSPRPGQGIWRHSNYKNLPEAKGNRQRLKNLRYLVTTGCNIPVFLSGMDSIQGVYRNENGYNFKWHNYYDRDDVLGWPLRPMGACFNPDQPGMSYGQLVTKDEEINAQSGLINSLLTSWNPLSHLNYWANSTLVKELSDLI